MIKVFKLDGIFIIVTEKKARFFVTDVFMESIQGLCDVDRILSGIATAELEMHFGRMHGNNFMLWLSVACACVTACNKYSWEFSDIISNELLSLGFDYTSYKLSGDVLAKLDILSYYHKERGQANLIDAHRNLIREEKGTKRHKVLVDIFS